MLLQAVAVVCLIWYLSVLAVCAIGMIQLYRWYSTNPPSSISATCGAEAPHVTIIRPIKGLDANLYDCLASTFHQDYPPDRRSVYFCVADDQDPAIPTVRRLQHQFQHLDVHLYLASDNSRLDAPASPLGPNPKIRSMSQAYREAKGNIVWVIDCNVWVAKGVCGRMVDALMGYGQRPNKFVHQLPLVVALSDSHNHHVSRQSNLGGRFEETWFSAAHAKFYTAINTVLVAPCIVGKSNMFRRDHLDALTQGQGIDYFSHNICEDHLIGDLLWKQPVPPAVLAHARRDPIASPAPWGNHALCFGDLAIQPMANMTVSDFFHRRVRWLRVRKYTVSLATLVEPGTESLLCSAYGAFALSSLPYFQRAWGISQSWAAFAAIFVLSVTFWAAADALLFSLMQSSCTIRQRDHVPDFVRHRKQASCSWLLAWLGREILALPIWIWAVYGGATVAWRGQSFKVGMDMRVRPVHKS